ncbi:MAG: hypothetical protein A2087_03815 [Spirochaetes bacterium GWD1_61_31]|nr:MAG: hypothetical protein A2Y37_05465 [Spirochaetes bacterium GWB1_60_80]OHD35634.1 MAG: hypothetical protein A2004_00005 [Spirochaetes bacterium GWC1_61_12]OHD42695.1 MAG: hypothetical protein A2087_03815 [Spirochaetes bacterium GWD1_61_31]OHD46113.1 MAG: hypothetical protein A2Y35_09515 [Spirochaetes bacterium GWE1_60_18]OHD60809.1 MAG: hypothetical protein A2Y32_14420 [Spirochaetes bacterium GWF1_60_12]
MPRPVNKAELLAFGDENLAKLLVFIEGLPKEFQVRSYENNELNDRDKTIADVICHLHEWHVMLKSWYKIGMSGKMPAIPAEDVTWSTLPILNHRIYDKYQGTTMPVAIKLLKKSHQDMLELIQKHSDDDLFTKKKYAWTGTTSLGAYLISATSSHYDWALKTIKPLKKLAK